METTTKPSKQNKDCLYNIRLTAEELQAWHDLAKETGFTKTSKMLHHAVEFFRNSKRPANDN